MLQVPVYPFQLAMLMKDSIVWRLQHLSPHSPQKNNNKNKFLDLPLDTFKKAIGLAVKELKRVKEKSEIGKGSTVV